MNIEYMIIMIVLLTVSLMIKIACKVRLFNSYRQGLLVFLIIYIVGIFWDIFATWRGHWAFPVGGTIGLYVFALPIEEYLFMFAVPFFIMVLYRAIGGGERHKCNSGCCGGCN